MRLGSWNTEGSTSSTSPAQQPAHVTFEPGWRWATDIKPLVGTDSCQAHHVDHRVADSLHVVTDEGNELDIGDGDAYEILPGHEAWVVGNETYSALEFQS